MSSAVEQTNELLRRVGGEDREAFARLYRLSAPVLFGICLRVMRDRDRASDVFQDAFVKIWTNASRYDASKGDALAWMVTVTRRCALDHLRRDARAPRADSPFVDEVLDRTPQGGRDDADSALWACLGRLDPRCHDAILLAFVYGLTHRELATRLARPMGTVKGWVRRGLGQLRDCLEGEDPHR